MPAPDSSMIEKLLELSVVGLVPAGRDRALRRGDEGTGLFLQRGVGEAGLQGVAVLDEADGAGGLWT